MEHVLTNLVDSTAAVYRDSMGIDAKQVLFYLILCIKLNWYATKVQGYQYKQLSVLR